MFRPVTIFIMGCSVGMMIGVVFDKNKYKWAAGSGIAALILDGAFVNTRPIQIIYESCRQ